MGIFSFLDPVLNLVLGPLLLLKPFWTLLIISFVISLLIVVIYKWVTDQNLMKQLKDEQKALQKQMRELKAHPEQAMKVQKKLMQTNMKYMTQSFKPTLITFIPIILIFGWLQGHLAYEPILPGQEFSAIVNFEQGTQGTISIDVPEGIVVTGKTEKTIEDGKSIFTMKGKQGRYLLEFTLDGKGYTKPVLITKERTYEKVEERFKDPVKSIQLDNKKTQVMNLFGWKLGWLGSYIIFSIVFSMLLRKLLKVY